MKKRLLSIVLVLVLCVGMLPTTVFAASAFKVSSSSLACYYTLKNVGTGKYLNVSNNSSSNNTNINIWAKDGTSGENFALYFDTSNKGYVIVPECSTKCAVNVYGSSAGAGKNICTWTKTGDSTQAWVIKAVSGGYIIQSANNKNYVLTASGSGNGSNVSLQKYSSTNKKQIWTFSLAKTISTTASFSSTSLTVSAGSTSTMKATLTGSSIASVSWSSSDTKICTVSAGSTSLSSSGNSSASVKVTGKKAGTAKVTINLKDSSGKTIMSKSFTVTVKQATSTTPSTSSTSSIEDQIKNIMKTTYSSSLTTWGKSEFNGLCGQCVATQLKVLGIAKSYDGFDGNYAYDKFKNSTKSTGGYTIKSYSVSNSSLKNFLTNLNNNVSCLDNQYLMLGFQTGTGDEGLASGHVLLIYAVYNGKVYYTESFVPSGQSTAYNCSKSIDAFCSAYTASTYSVEGAILFSK